MSDPVGRGAAETAATVERLSEAAHDAWMESKRSQGVTTRCSEWGEELMVPYDALSEEAKDLDRGTVHGVLNAIERAGLMLAAVASDTPTYEPEPYGWLSAPDGKFMHTDEEHRCRRYRVCELGLCEPLFRRVPSPHTDSSET